MNDFEYRLGDTGTVLNPSSPSVPFVDITEFKGWDSPPFRTTERDHEGTDGGFIDAEFEKMRTFILEGQIITNNVNTETFLDALKVEWAAGRGILPFYVKHPGIDERVAFVKPLGVKYDINTLRRVGSADVQFMCQAENPMLFDSTIQSKLINQGVSATTGFGFNLGFNFGFGAAIDPTTTNAINSGNRPTPVTITIPGPVTNPRIYHAGQSKEMIFSIILGASDTLVIDSYYRTVKLNGTVSRRGTLIQPDWFYLNVGDNFLQYRADTTGNPAATVTYRNAWR